jgi:chaperonin GroEL
VRSERPIISGHRWRGGRAGGRIVAGLTAQIALCNGMTQLTDLLRPTLGPMARTVAISSDLLGRPPEILDAGSVIARRVTQLSDADENMGAMLLRHVLWRVHERVGDGAATTAVLMQGLMDGAVTYLASGGDPVAIRSGIDQAAGSAVAELERIARSIETPNEISRVVRGIVLDEALSELIGEILDVVGPDGVVDIEDGVVERTTCEYVDGVRWREGVASPFFLADGSTTATVDHPSIFVTDRPLTRGAELIPVIETCLAADRRALAVIAPDVRDEALALLILNRDRGVLDSAIALKTPGFGEQASAVIEDIAVITGARCFRSIEGASTKKITVGDLGGARQVWATRTLSGILGGTGAQPLRRRRASDVGFELKRATDDATRETLRERLGRLNGVAAIVRVGGSTEAEQAELKHRAAAAFAAGRAALRGGVAPGGGAAFLLCQNAVQSLALEGDEAVGARMMFKALEAPIEAILANAGFEPFPIIDGTRRREATRVFDVVRREWVDPWSDGPTDSVALLRTALELAADGASMALTIGALVRSRHPEVSLAP